MCALEESSLRNRISLSSVQSMFPFSSLCVESMFPICSVCAQSMFPFSSPCVQPIFPHLSHQPVLCLQAVGSAHPFLHSFTCRRFLCETNDHYRPVHLKFSSLRFKAICVNHFRFRNLFWIQYMTCDKVEMMRYGPRHLQLNLGLDGLLPFLRRLSYSHTLSPTE